MTIDILTYAELRDLELARLRTAIPGLSTGQASEARLRAEIHAAIHEGLYQYLKWTIDQRFPDTASSTNLERHAALLEIERRDPAQSTGTVQLTGTPGTAFLTGLQFQDAADQLGQTTAAGTLDPITGKATVTAESIDTGLAINWATGEAFELTAPPAGVDSAATAASDFTGGADEESDAALLARLLLRLQYPPAGGTRMDWLQWALEVDGVYAAWVHPLRRGPGTIDVTIAVQGAGGHLDLPTPTLLAEVEAYLDTKRPVTTKDHQVVAPDQVLVAVTVDGLEVEDGFDPATVKTAVEDAIPSFFDALEPGETVYRVAIILAVGAVDGVKNFVLTAPVADVPLTIDEVTAELAFPGVVTVNLA